MYISILKVNLWKIKQEIEPSHPHSLVLSEDLLTETVDSAYVTRVWKSCLLWLSPLPRASPVHSCLPLHTAPPSSTQSAYWLILMVHSDPVLLFPSDVVVALYCSVTSINQYLVTWSCFENFLCTSPFIFFSTSFTHGPGLIVT